MANAPGAARASRALLDAFRPGDPREEEDLDAIREVASRPRPFDRASRFHLTASALVVDPSSTQVLLRWHSRLGAWMQVGGHGDPGETDPYAIARREANEETGLGDLASFPDPQLPQLIQVAVVAVPSSAAEPAHLHGDVRFVMTTSAPDAIVAESPESPLRWCTFPEGESLIGEDNLRTLLQRTAMLLRA